MALRRRTPIWQRARAAWGSREKSRGALRLRAGESVEIRSEAEILATLDERGTLEGLPFMPEMVPFCGQPARVFKRADKTCDTIENTGSRRMLNTVHLDGLRCSGAAHGGCQALCLLFWKEAWLKRPAPPAPRREGRGDDEGPEQVAPVRCDRRRLLELTRGESEAGGDAVYRCQATELGRASSPLAWWDPRQYMRDVWSRNASVKDVMSAAVLRLFGVLLRLRGYRLLMWTYDRVQRVRGGRPYPYFEGRAVRTPRATLGLQPGELVRVRPRDQILETIDSRNRNRGLSFDPEMAPYCGETHRVLQRVNRIINERTGRMIHLATDCVMLEDVVCRARYSHRRLFCPRSIYPFWREIWLQRIEGRSGSPDEPPS
jgi:hypothetical protein